MVVEKPTKGLIQLCNRMGDKYSIRVFDGQNVLYRKLENGFDIEVRNVDSNSPTCCCNIYVWDNRTGHHIVDTRIVTIQSKLHLTIETLVQKYMLFS